MFSRSGVKNLRKMGLALALAGSLVAGLTVEPVRAAYYTPSMMCGTSGFGSITLEMPSMAPGRWSMFYYSVDGGEWQKTGWYFSEYGKFYQWDARAQQRVRIWPNGNGPTLLFSGSHSIHAYEWNGSYFTDLLYCNTSSINSYFNGFNENSWR